MQTPENNAPTPASKPRLSQGHVMALSAGALMLVASVGAYFLKNSAPSADDSVAAYMEALQANNAGYAFKNATGSYLSGKFSASQGDVKTALKQIGETMAYQQADPQLLRQAYRLSVLAGDLEQAGTYSEKLPAAEEDRLLSPKMLQAVVAIKKNDFVKAEKLLLDLSPDGANTLFMPILQGWVAVGNNKPLDIKSLEASLMASGQFKPLLHYQIALLLDAAGKLQESKAHYDAVFEQKQLSYRIAQVLVNFYQRQNDVEKVKTILQRYEEQFHHPLGAVTQKPIVVSPREGAAEIFYGISSLLFSLQAYAEAQIPLQIALDLRADFDAVHFLQANLLERQERYDEAVLVYQKLKNHPAFGLQAQIRMAYCYQDSERNTEALELLEQTTKQFPSEVEPLLTRADILRVTQKYAQAIEVYTQALAMKKKALAEQWPVYYSRGICYERSNQWEKAEADFMEALRLEPDQPDVLNYLGYSWLIQNKNLNQAKEMIEKAMAARPNDAQIIDSMGWALYHLGEYEEALEYIEQAIELAPRDATVNEHLGDIYWRLGYKLQAKYQWERAIFFEPEEAGQEESIRKKIAEGLPAVVAKKPEMLSQNAADALTKTE